MRATTIHGPRDIRVEDRPDPTITAPTDAIVAVTASCICGSDLRPYRGENDITPGETIGHECVGVVEEVGSEVRNISVGDFVIAPFCHSDNTCAHCQVGMTSACEHVGFTTSGQAEFALITQADGSLVATPEQPDADLIPSLLTLSDVMATGWHAAVSAGVAPGQTVVVIGDGAVGLCGVLAAAQLGAEQVIVMSRHAPRQELARRFGASDIVAERGVEGAEKIADLTNAAGADAVLECVGTNDAFRQALLIARPGSMVGFVGVPHGVEVSVRRMFDRNVGLRGGMAPVRAYLPALLDLVWNQQIEPGLVFDSTLPLEQSPEGYAAMDERRAIKVLLRP